jgi:hypothetical protein
MTEADWLLCDYPQEMLESLRGRAPGRKVRLFGVACCRLIENLFTNPDARKVIELAEAFADEHADRETLFSAINERIRRMLDDCESRYGVTNRLLPEIEQLLQREQEAVSAACVFLSWRTEGAAYYETGMLMRYVANRVAGSNPIFIALLHDLFQNIVCPVPFDPTWCTSDVLLLARGIYEERAFDRMPILADALQEAGCDNPDILSHCRDAMQPHVRGCWVVDLVLGKE